MALANHHTLPDAMSGAKLDGNVGLKVPDVPPYDLGHLIRSCIEHCFL